MKQKPQKKGEAGCRKPRAEETNEEEAQELPPVHQLNTMRKVRDS